METESHEYDKQKRKSNYLWVGIGTFSVGMINENSFICAAGRVIIYAGKLWDSFMLKTHEPKIHFTTVNLMICFMIQLLLDVCATSDKEFPVPKATFIRDM